MEEKIKITSLQRPLLFEGWHLLKKTTTLQINMNLPTCTLYYVATTTTTTTIILLSLSPFCISTTFWVIFYS